MSVLPFRWGDHHVNLIDTPGYADFAGEVEAARRVADLLVFVVDAVGVQSEDERLWRVAAARGISSRASARSTTTWSRTWSSRTTRCSSATSKVSSPRPGSSSERCTTGWAGPWSSRSEEHTSEL